MSRVVSAPAGSIATCVASASTPETRQNCETTADDMPRSRRVSTEYDDQITAAASASTRPGWNVRCEKSPPVAISAAPVNASSRARAVVPVQRRRERDDQHRPQIVDQVRLDRRRGAQREEQAEVVAEQAVDAERECTRNRG